MNIGEMIAENVSVLIKNLMGFTGFKGFRRIRRNSSFPPSPEEGPKP
jgi:hypothetical protein